MIWAPILAAAIIVVAGVLIGYLVKRRPKPPAPPIKLEGPKVLLGTPSHRPGRSAALIGELKSREDSLERFVDTGASGLKRRVVDIRRQGPRAEDDEKGADR